MRYAFITSAQFRELYEDDRLAADELRQRGHDVTPVVWTEPASLDAFDVVVMRSPWDWFLHRERFRAFLESLRGIRARVVNDAETMLAFADKTYLPRLAAKGVDVVPTVQLTQAELTRVPALLAERDWSRAVLKPTFTANAVGARLFSAREASHLVAELEDASPWLLQPFVPSIADGELSFVFFGGVFSHAVRKRPPSGEWRVQHEYGGSSEPATVSAQEIAEATALLAASAPGTSYARVDAVEWNGRLHLMELEVVEPELFFRHRAEAPRAFVDALTQRASSTAPRAPR
jgi:glutathione synthase/RimK-type ligase-like ATP-grasp enzyme